MRGSTWGAGALESLSEKVTLSFIVDKSPHPIRGPEYLNSLEAPSAGVAICRAHALFMQNEVFVCHYLFRPGSAWVRVSGLGLYVYFQSHSMQSVGTPLAGSDRNVRHMSSHHKAGFIGWTPTHVTDSAKIWKSKPKKGPRMRQGLGSSWNQPPEGCQDCPHVSSPCVGFVSPSCSRLAFSSWQKNIAASLQKGVAWGHALFAHRGFKMDLIINI